METSDWSKEGHRPIDKTFRLLQANQQMTRDALPDPSIGYSLYVDLPFGGSVQFYSEFPPLSAVH